MKRSSPLLPQGGTRRVLLCFFLLIAVFFLFACADEATPNSQQQPTDENGNSDTIEKKSEEKDILSLSFQSLSGGASVSSVDIQHENARVVVTQELPFGDTIARSLRIATVSVSEKASITPSNNQEIPLTLNRGTVVVTAEDESEKSYTVELVVVSADPVVELTYIGQDGENSSVLSQGIHEASVGTSDILFVVGKLMPNASFSWRIDGGSSVQKSSDAQGKMSFSKNDNVLSYFTASASSATNYEKQHTVTIYSSETLSSKDAYLHYKPREIWTWHDLQAIRFDLAGTYVQKADIGFPDLNGDGQNNQHDYAFVPIARDTTPNTGTHEGTKFTGSFDGGNHTITNLFIDKREDEFVGLFSYVGANSLVRAHLKSAIVLGKNIVGGIAGFSDTASLIDGSVSGTIIGGILLHTFGNNQKKYIGTGTHVGGLVGQSRGSIRGHNEATVKGGVEVGGLVGEVINTSISSEGTLIRGYNSGIVWGNVRHVGGLVGLAQHITGGTLHGYNVGYVENLSTTATESENTGGLVGFADKFTIYGYNAGVIKGQKNVGGIGGTIGSSIVAGFNNVAITGNTHVGGLVGRSTSQSTINGYNANKATITGLNFVGGIGGSFSNTTSRTYNRSRVVRDSGNGTYFGRIIGHVSGSSSSGFFSRDIGEDNLEECDLLSGSPHGDALQGTSASINHFTENNVNQTTFTSAQFVFGTQLGKWAWHDSRWPSIVLPPEIGEDATQEKQPTIPPSVPF